MILIALIEFALMITTFFIYQLTKIDFFGWLSILFFGFMVLDIKDEI